MVKDLCGGTSKATILIFSVLRHTKLHGEARPHSCIYCEKTFVRGDALTRHLRNRPPACRVIREYKREQVEAVEYNNTKEPQM